MPCPEDQLAVSATCGQCLASRNLSRRGVLKSALRLGLGLQFVSHITYAAEAPQKARPQAGDVFVFSLGDRQGQPVTLQDLPLGGPPIVAYPMDAGTQIVRNGSRLNRVLLVRLATKDLTAQTRTTAAEGIVAYSAICPHTGCDVAGWQADTKHFVCPCHASTFDPQDRAKVVSGPAPRSLAVLPLRITDGKLTVAGPFAGRVGFN
ncbi:MAG: ubiquinol-cytochrome c reductase iron-sulfur subunit [Candidatus Binatia bacterium]